MDTQAETRTTGPPNSSQTPRKRPWTRRRSLIVLAILLGCVLLLGPWPLSRAHWRNSQYARETLSRVDRIEPAARSGRLQIGTARREIPALAGIPLAGYSARSPKRATGRMEPLYARAITVSDASRTVTILSAEILLFLPELRQAVLQRTGLQPEQIYFTSSHTHSGPGGYSSGWIDQLVLGPYRQRRAEALAEACAAAVRDSRRQLTAATVSAGFVELLGPGQRPLLENRVMGGPADSRLWAVRFSDAEGNLAAAMLIFNAHPTCLGPDNRRVSGDWPGPVQRQLEARTGGVVLTAAGSVGSARVRTALPRGLDRRDQLARRVAEGAAGLLDRLGPGAATSPPAAGRIVVEPRSEVAICSRIVRIDLPETQYRLSDGLRLSPLVSGLVHERRSFVQLLAIGPILLLAQPGDFGEALGAQLTDEGLDRAQAWIATSFNGDYLGYLVPPSYYDTGHYEVRDMNLFGPFAGQYLLEISRRAGRRILPPPDRDGSD